MAMLLSYLLYVHTLCTGVWLKELLLNTNSVSNVDQVHMPIKWYLWRFVSKTQETPEWQYHTLDCGGGGTEDGNL